MGVGERSGVALGDATGIEEGDGVRLEDIGNPSVCSLAKYSFSCSLSISLLLKLAVKGSRISLGIEGSGLEVRTL